MEDGPLPLTPASIINYANYLRANRLQPARPIYRAKKEIQYIQDWFKEYKASPFQARFINRSIRVVYTQQKRYFRPTVHNPGNREHITAINTISASIKAIPSFLILQGKTIQKDYLNTNLPSKLTKARGKRSSL
ncbi:hypothetical protein LX36DRAFT_653456 [Colletotrichum falcatum]|nr:hypothetical protein LX36DRAFT_653456 [Colletotrichum falcatum]